jgi:hypothetical protein
MGLPKEKIAILVMKSSDSNAEGQMGPLIKIKQTIL